MSAPLLNSAGEPYAAVSFDVDGTLYQPGLRVYFRAFTTPGAARTFGLLKRAREKLRETPFVDGEALRDALSQSMAELGSMQALEAAALLVRTRDVYWPRLLTGVTPDATRRALQSLKDKGIRLAAFSDHDAEVKITTLGLRPLFDAVVSAEDTGAYKPHVRGFERVCAALGLAPAQVLHVGDRADTDGKGALAAGLGAVLVGIPSPHPQMHRVGDLAELASRVCASRR